MGAPWHASQVDTVIIPRAVFTRSTNNGTFEFTIATPPGRDNIEIASITLGFPIVKESDAAITGQPVDLSGACACVPVRTCDVSPLLEGAVLRSMFTRPHTHAHTHTHKCTYTNNTTDLEGEHSHGPGPSHEDTRWAGKDSDMKTQATASYFQQPYFQGSV